MIRSSHFTKLESSYIFPEIQKRKSALQKRNPSAKILNLGIGDTTQPITPKVVKGFTEAVIDLGDPETYTGYGPWQGDEHLRKMIAKHLYSNIVKPHELFVSDGAKCDVGRLQLLFGSDAKIAVQDPTYPVYVDTSIISGKKGIHYMPCLPENDFFPELNSDVDLIFFCSPNNPTGVVATKEQLKKLVDHAKKISAIIIFDSAYAGFIQDKSLPKSIYEIEGAREVAIEVGSFSKLAGFTGVRLGFTIVPDELCFDDGTPVKQDFSRLHSTFFNGACNIAQKGGIAVLENLQEIQLIINHYMENTKKLKSALTNLGFATYGGDNAPYVWARFPHESSWVAFEEMLDKLHIVSVPGSAFGPAGEGFLRFSGLGKQEEIDEAIRRLRDAY